MYFSYESYGLWLQRHLLIIVVGRFIMIWLIRLIPLMVLASSYASYRYIPFRRQRLVLYFWILAGIITMNTLYISFANDLYDAIATQSALFMIYEFFFTITAKRTSIVKRISWVAGILLFTLSNMQWVSFGFPHMRCLWETTPVSSYTSKQHTYAVKDLVRYKYFKPARTFLYKKQYLSLPFEKAIKAYTVPPGYEFSNFSYTWSSPVTTGLQVDLIVDNYVLWSLGEGL